MKPTFLHTSFFSAGCALLLASGVSIQAQPYSNAVAALHPVAYWPLQETVAPPSSPPTYIRNYGTLGESQNGVLNGNVIAGAGPVAGSRANAFDGVASTLGAFVRAPYTSGGSPPLPFTIEAWVNTSYPINNGPSGANQNVILADYSASPDANHRTGWVLFNDYWKDEQSGYTKGDFALKSYQNGTSTQNPHFFTIMNQNTVQAGVWYHVVIVLTSSNAVSYVNGAPAGTGTGSSAYVPNNNDGGASYGLTIATRGANGSDNTLNWGGAVSEVAYYTNVMSASDALADYNAMTNVATYEALVAARHPIFWYKMDELTNQPVATNYGSFGAAANGYYPTDFTGNNYLVPGVAGPTDPGFGATSFAWQAGPGQLTTSTGPGLPCGACNPAMWSLPGSITVMAWANPMGGTQELVSNGDASFRLLISSGGFPHFAYAGNDLAGAKAVDGQWHYFVGTYNSTNNSAVLYVDGVQAGAATFTAPTLGLRASQFLIGGASDHVGYNLVGNIAHVAIFNSALSAGQVATLYNTAVGALPPVVVTPVFPNSSAEYWSSSTYVFRPVFNGFGASFNYVWTLDSGSGPVAISGATGSSLALQSIPGLTVGGSYTLTVNGTTTNGSVSSSVSLTIDAPPAVARTIYSDSFTRSGALDGSQPDTANLYSAAWAANGSFSCNGSGAVNSSAYPFAAWLPFIPQAGHLYVLSCDLNPLNGDDNWLGLGFSTKQVTGLFTADIATAVEARGNRASGNFGGMLVPDGLGSATGVTPYDASGVSTYQIKLDTTTEPWGVSFWEDGILQGAPMQYSSDPSIASVVMENYQTGNGVFDNFKLTDSGVSSGAPVFVENPPSQLFALQSFTAVIPAVAAGATSYRWQFNGNNLADNGRITGSQANRLTILCAQPGDAGSYQLIAQNGSGSVTSSPCAFAVGAAPVSFSSADAPAAWTVNTPITSGSYTTTILTNNVLTLTDGTKGEACSAFFNVPQYIGAFYAQFTYQVVNPIDPSGDGATFCLQNDPRGPAACGSVTYSFGLRGNGGSILSVAPSVELCLNLYSPMALVGYSWNTDGHITLPSQHPPGSVNIANGDPITMSLYYNGSTLALTVVDSGPVATNKYSTTLAVGDITADLGSTSAYVGFGGSDGDAASTQIITNFTFVSLPTLPKLAVSECAGGTAGITWPGTFAGLTLQHSSDLTTTNWVNVTNQVTATTNGTCQVTVPTAGSSRFYRLTAGPQ